MRRPFQTQHAGRGCWWQELFLGDLARDDGTGCRAGQSRRGRSVKVASIEMEELDSRLPAASLVGPAPGQSRQLGLVLGKRRAA